MLIINCHENQGIMVGDDFLVTVTEIRASRVKLEVSATHAAGGGAADGKGELPWLDQNGSLHIAPDAICIVIDVRHDAVRLAFDAPRELSILRKESYDAIQRFRRNGGEDDDDDYTL